MSGTNVCYEKLTTFRLQEKLCYAGSICTQA